VQPPSLPTDGQEAMPGSANIKADKSLHPPRLRPPGTGFGQKAPARIGVGTLRVPLSATGTRSVPTTNRPLVTGTSLFLKCNRAMDYSGPPQDWGFPDLIAF
jgi:hypothetical protein